MEQVTKGGGLALTGLAYQTTDTAQPAVDVGCREVNINLDENDAVKARSHTTWGMIMWSRMPSPRATSAGTGASLVPTAGARLGRDR